MLRTPRKLLLAVPFSNPGSFLFTPPPAVFHERTVEEMQENVKMAKVGR
jgi:hypothetical protein